MPVSEVESTFASIVNDLQDRCTSLPRLEPVVVTLRKVKQAVEDGELRYVVEESETVRLPQTHESSYPSRMAALGDDSATALLQDLAEFGAESKLWQRATDAKLFDVGRQYAEENRLDGNKLRYLSSALSQVLVARKGATLSFRSMP